MDGAAEAETYQKRIQSLNLDKLDSDETRKTVLDLFSSKYLLLPETWKLRIQCEKNLSYSDMKKLLIKALNDFYFEDIFDAIDSKTKELFELEINKFKENPFDRCLNFRYFEVMKAKCNQLLGQPKLEELLKDALSFPHSKLRQVYNAYKKFSGKFINKNTLKCFYRNLALYQKIKDSENNLLKWCYWIEYTKDDRFIIQNYQYLLAKKPFEIKLWKTYIFYMLKFHKKAAISVYHRYRKLFVDDKSMENFFSNFKDEEAFNNICYLEKAKFRRPNLKRKIPQPSKSLTAYKKLPKIQAYSFRASFLNYFLKHASMELAIKLFQSCKQLYFFKKIPFCHSIFVGSNSFETKYFKDSLFINETAINRLPNVCLEMNLVMEKCSNCNILSRNIIPKLKTCTLEYLSITDQNISTAEYEFLTKSETLDAVVFDSSVSINDNNGNPITLQNLIQHLINAYLIKIPVKTTITAETASCINQMNMKRRPIVYIHILICDSSLCFPSIEWINFCTKYKKPDNFIIHVSWDKNITEEQLSPIDISMHNALHEWKKNHPNEIARLYFKNS